MGNRGLFYLDDMALRSLMGEVAFSEYLWHELYQVQGSILFFEASGIEIEGLLLLRDTICDCLMMEGMNG